jgi:hypothetical protein
MLLSKEPVPQPIQALVGLVPHRDPEAWKEKKRLEREQNQAEREARAEREAIKWESRQAEKERARQVSLPAAKQTSERAAGSTRHLIDIESESTFGHELPQPAAAGWYRLGRDFYRVGQGPFPQFGTTAAEEIEQPKGQMVQHSLF